MESQSGKRDRDGKRQRPSDPVHDAEREPRRYVVVIERRASKSLDALPTKVQKQLMVKIDALAHEPRPAGCVKLQGHEESYRIRSGDYRIVYDVEDGRLVVLVVRVGHRKDVYWDM